MATVATIWGEKCVMRILDKTRSVLRLDDLGMPADTHETFSQMVRAPFGMVLCAGPTGSGKTTTLYATLSEINDPTRNIMTIEDPVEYVFPSINQIQTNEQAGLDLRHRAEVDPAPGPRRDPGRRDPRRRDGPDRGPVRAHRPLRALVAARHRLGLGPAPLPRHGDRVVPHRLVGPRHRRPAPGPAHLPVVQDDLHADATRSWPSTRRAAGPTRRSSTRATGCNFCAGTGYQDRIGVYELLQITPEIKRLIVGWATQDELRRLAQKQGMRTLREEAIDLVAAGRHHHRRSHPQHLLALRQENRYGQVRLHRDRSRRRHDVSGVDGRQSRRARPTSPCSSAASSRSKLIEKKSILQFEITKKKVPRKDIMHFSRQLGVFVKAGIPILDALEVIAEETTEQAVQEGALRHDRGAPGGRHLRRGRGRPPRGLPRFYVGILDSAELTGNLDTVLEPARRLHRAGPRRPQASSPRR